MLALYRSGDLGKAEASKMEGHIRSCPLCRHELMMIDRFESIDGDTELERASGWKEARSGLERFFSEDIIKRSSTVTSRPGKKTGGLFQLRWLASAAAVVLIIIASIVGRGPGDVENGPTNDPVRGDGAEKIKIRLIEPAGDLGEAPGIFRWKTDEEFDFFSLEIFDADLAGIFSRENIKGMVLTLPDSTTGVFKKGETYIWSVKGHKGVTLSISGDQWFRISGGDGEKRPAEGD